MATGGNPHGNLRICKALKEPRETVQGDCFHLPRPSGTMGDLAGFMWLFLKQMQLLISGPCSPPSSGMHAWIPMLVSDLETHTGHSMSRAGQHLKDHRERHQHPAARALKPMMEKTSDLSSWIFLHVVKSPSSHFDSCGPCFHISDGGVW